MGLFMLSRILGLARTMVFGYYFGAGPEMDAYTYASRIPDLLFNIVAGGALGSAFIPIFIARRSTGDEEGAWRLASALVNLVWWGLLLLGAVTFFGAPWLVRTLVAPEATVEIQARAVLLLRVMLLSPAIFGVSGIVMGVLNGCQHFALPAFAPVLYNLALIVGAIWGGETGQGLLGAAVGTVVGALLHLAVKLPALPRYRARYFPTWGLRDPSVHQVWRMMLPRIFGVAAVQFNFVITNNLASGLEVGAVSILLYAWMIVLLPNVLAQAVGTTAFPTFSEQSAQQDFAALRKTVAQMLRVVTAVMLPASVGLAVLGRPLVALAFERGAFSAGSTEGVAWALACFAVGLVGHGAIEILARAFYALHDTWTPALMAVGAVAVNVALGLTLPGVFVRIGWPSYAGLALANGIAALAEMVALLWLLGPKVRGLAFAPLLTQGARVLLASLGMGVVVWGWLQLAPASPWVQSLGGIALGVVAYGALALALRIDELRLALRLVLRRG